MSAFRKANADKFERAGENFPETSQQAFHRYMKGSTKKVSTARGVFKTAWLYFWDYHGGEVISNFYQSLSLESNAKVSHPLVASVRKLVDPALPVDTSFLTRLRGRYMVVRPFFNDVSRIMIHELLCGHRSLSSFYIRIAYPDKGVTVKERAFGHIVPLSDSILFIGKIGKIDVPFIFVLHDIEKSKHDGNYETAHGALIVGANKIAPSAFPLLVIRHSGNIDPAVFHRSDVPKKISSNPEFEKMILRCVASTYS